MSKRRRGFEETEDPESYTGPNKRGRTASEESNLDPASTEKRAQEKSWTRHDDDMSDTQPDNVHSKETREEKLERIIGEKLLAKYEKQRQQRIEGAQAESGIIEYVEMHQFMCHKFLKFTFGPRINFIIGHNGSGKSAVLSAITIALGGKTKFTGRGTGLKSFIREGQGVAEVTIHLKNRGDDAFKHEIYGNTIIITRRFTKEGASTWKIKRSNGKVISTKKEELTAICDHMDIQVDNPMAVLTQDAARQFLSVSTPKDKYKFFLRGTQLAQLEEEYEIIGNNTTLIEQTIVAKESAIPDAELRLERAEACLTEASKAQEQEHKIDNLKRELAWAYVADKRGEMEAAMEDAASQKRRLSKIEENLRQSQSTFDDATEVVVALEAELKAMGNIEDLDARKASFVREIRDNKNRILDFKNEIGEMKKAIQEFDCQIEQLDKNIEEQRRLANIDNQAKLLEIQDKIQELEDTFRAAGRQLRDLGLERQNVEAAAAEIRANGESKNAQKATLEQEIKDCDNMISSAKKAEKDALIPYGNNMKDLLNKIKSLRWYGDVPLGPFGLYVKAKNPEKWGHLLRSRLSQYLLMFAITDARDFKVLKNLLVDSKNRYANIIIYEKDMFEYRHGEPEDEHIHTVLRELEISDPWVLRLLINQAHIENQVLADTRAEGEKTLKTFRKGGNAWTNDGFAVTVYPEGGQKSSPIDIKQKMGPMNLLLTHRNPTAEISHFAQRKRQLEDDIKIIASETEALRNQYMQMKIQIDGLKAREKELQGQQLLAKSQQADLQQEANDDMPVDIQALEDTKQSIIQDKDGVLTQLEHVCGEKEKVDRVQINLQQQMNEVKKVMSDFFNRRNVHIKMIEDAVTKRMQAQNDKNHYERKVETEKKITEAAEANADVLADEFNVWTQNAIEYSPEEVPNPRKPDDIKQHITSIEQALKARAEQGGISIEEANEQVEKAKGALNSIRKEQQAMIFFCKALKMALERRVVRWIDFRAFKTIQCKLAFQNNLANRGYFGTITTKHSKGELELHVETDDQHFTQGRRGKNPDLLSGGEKSFTTICLLLSIWNCIGCPLKCLDEFDVFMDAVNRRISMKMLIDVATMSDKKQYVFITPLDIGNITVNDNIQVHKMSDPERSRREW